MSMESSYPSKLRLWNHTAATWARDWGGGSAPASAPSGPVVQGPHPGDEFAQRLYTSEALQPPPSAVRKLEKAEPYSLQWFLNIETLRHTRQGRWIPHLLEFSKHAGETLLGLGHGLGTDWLQYARHGASVVVCSPSTSQLALVRRNFELRNLAGRFVHAAPVNLPLESASIDVACVAGLLETVAEPRLVINEIYRVLKPGGKVVAVAPAAFDVDFWQRCAFVWKWWRRRKRVVPEEATRFSGRTLRRLFGRFVEHRVQKRHLRRADVPHLWRWLPLAVLERLMGRVLVLKAFKPLSAALPAEKALAA
jgi:ubiquinone/menaquinone biosynthesis C-methylase UbiE